MKLPTDIEMDPFAERPARLQRWSQALLGVRVQFESTDPRLLQLARTAFAGLPGQRFPHEERQLRIALRIVPGDAHARPFRRPARLFSGGGLLGGLGADHNAVLLAPELCSGLVQVSTAASRHAYQVRYEMIEFAVYALAARVQQLASLHAAAVGRQGRGLLLMGPTGAGKSTLALLSALRGLSFLSEDSAFVEPRSLLVTGVPNFLHARADALRWVASAALREQLRRSPVIRRRSGVRKFEIDLRQKPFRVARAPLQVSAMVLLSPRPRPGKRLLVDVSTRTMKAELRKLQGYAAQQPAWPQFERRLPDVWLLRLHRGTHPEAAVDALEELLG